MSHVAFLFPGQGAQYVGMGKKLAQSLPAAQALFDRANDVLGYDLAEYCFHGPAERLNTTDVAQPALFVTSLAALEALRSESPDIVAACRFAAGLSVGEYTAMAFASAMDFETALRIVQQRGKAMQEAADQSPSGMASVLGLEEDQLERLCEEAREQDVLQIANYLCPGNLAVSGHLTAIERLKPLAKDAGAIDVVDLAVAGAFHTPLMEPATAAMAAELGKTAIRCPRVPVVSNVDAIAHSDPESIRQLLVRQIVEPVMWEESVRRMMNDGVTTFYEIGPGRVLRGLVKRIRRKVSVENVIG